jgi:hypothetical protein
MTTTDRQLSEGWIKTDTIMKSTSRKQISAHSIEKKNQPNILENISSMKLNKLDRKDLNEVESK